MFVYREQYYHERAEPKQRADEGTMPSSMSAGPLDEARRRGPQHGRRHHRQAASRPDRHACSSTSKACSRASATCARRRERCREQSSADKSSHARASHGGPHHRPRRLAANYRILAEQVAARPPAARAGQGRRLWPGRRAVAPALYRGGLPSISSSRRWTKRWRSGRSWRRAQIYILNGLPAGRRPSIVAAEPDAGPRTPLEQIEDWGQYCRRPARPAALHHRHRHVPARPLRARL